MFTTHVRHLITLAALLSTVLLAACGSGGAEPSPGGADLSITRVAGTPTPRASTTRLGGDPAADGFTAEAIAVATAPADVVPTATSEPAITSISELVARYGEPPGATFARVRIPLLGVDAPVGVSVVQGQMVAPANPVEVFWYDLSGYPGMGGLPGAGGNAIFSAHVDYAARVPYAGVRYRGLGVFGSLKLLSAGDVIEIDYGGQALRYAVSWRRQVDAATEDWAAIWSDAVATDSITLYTCAGNFNRDSRSYDDRIVLRAERI